MLRSILLLTMTTLAIGVACTVSEEDACADDQVYEAGACRPRPADSGSGGEPPTSTAGSPATGDGGTPAATGGTPSVAFGTSCESHADCGAPTDYCADSPVASPYCTAAGCDETPDICPEGWACFDVSQFAPGEPWICMQPLE